VCSWRWILSAMILFIYVTFGVFAAPFTRLLMPITVVALCFGGRVTATQGRG